MTRRGAAARPDPGVSPEAAAQAPAEGAPHIRATGADIAHLSARDKALGRLMAALGPLEREGLPDPFTALIHAIAGQQISAAAHASVWRRLLAAFPCFTPEKLAGAAPEDLRACGLSLRKAGYVREIARRAASGELDVAGLAALDDAALCTALRALPGVGQWTAEMLMIFSLGRRDVLSLGDFGIRKGLRMLYSKKELTATFLARVRKRYSPCASVASLYLWALAGGAGGPDYSDPARPKKKKIARARAAAKKGARRGPGALREEQG